MESLKLNVKSRTSHHKPLKGKTTQVILSVDNKVNMKICKNMAENQKAKIKLFFFFLLILMLSRGHDEFLTFIFAVLELKKM